MSNRHLAGRDDRDVAFAGRAAQRISHRQICRSKQSSFLGGVDWGNVGPYEMLQGTAYLEVDPRGVRAMPSSSISRMRSGTRME
jgi:hypothetical protein